MVCPTPFFHLSHSIECNIMSATTEIHQISRPRRRPFQFIAFMCHGDKMASAVESRLLHKNITHPLDCTQAIGVPFICGFESVNYHCNIDDKDAHCGPWFVICCCSLHFNHIALFLLLNTCLLEHPWKHHGCVHMSALWLISECPVVLAGWSLCMAPSLNHLFLKQEMHW